MNLLHLPTFKMCFLWTSLAVPSSTQKQRRDAPCKNGKTFDAQLFNTSFNSFDRTLEPARATLAMGATERSKVETMKPLKDEPGGSAAARAISKISLELMDGRRTTTRCD